MDPLKVLWVLTNSTYLVSKYMKASAESDKRPTFGRDLYQAEIGEGAKSKQAVVTVTADNHHKFPDIRYEISGGNVDGTFAVNSKTGEIYTLASLDYESRHKYELVYSATSQHAVAYTSIVITVTDENDNPPVFEKSVYVTEVTEEDDRNMPRKILQVCATDGDRDQPVDIVYFLAGQGIDPDDPETGNFAIDKNSGEIFVLKPLDRDPPAGRPQWRFTAFAQDEGGRGLVGFADVHVDLRDVNDNAPIFTQPSYAGNVTENGPKGLLVVALEAEDADDPLEGGNARVRYSIEKNAVDDAGRPVFGVDAANGELRTLVCCLDRERAADYSLQVIAVDGAGLRGTATVTIRVLDINDSAPVFTKDEWETEVQETVGEELSAAPALTVAVRDADLDSRFVYSVVERSGYGAERFRMVTNEDGTGSLLVARPLDYEDPLQRNGFRFQIQVLDEDETGSHVAFAWVSMRLLDVNDNAPSVEVRPDITRVREDVRVGHVVTRLTARDRDNGGRTAVRFVVDRATDRQRLFQVTQAGELIVRRPLDRETAPRHLVSQY